MAVPTFNNHEQSDDDVTNNCQSQQRAFHVWTDYKINSFFFIKKWVLPEKMVVNKNRLIPLKMYKNTKKTRNNKKIRYKILGIISDKDVYHSL